MASNNQKTKRIAYIHEKYRAFVDRPELINDILEVAMKDAINFLGKDATLQAYLDNYSAIQESKKEKIREKVHQEDLDFLKVIMQSLSSGPITTDHNREQLPPQKKEPVNNEIKSNTSENQTAPSDDVVDKSDDSLINGDVSEDSVVNKTVEDFFRKIQN